MHLFSSARHVYSSNCNLSRGLVPAAVNDGSVRCEHAPAPHQQTMCSTQSGTIGVACSGPTGASQKLANNGCPSPRCGVSIWKQHRRRRSTSDCAAAYAAVMSRKCRNTTDAGPPLQCYLVVLHPLLYFVYTFPFRANVGILTKWNTSCVSSA